jgi:hypothetical protein
MRYLVVTLLGPLIVSCRGSMPQLGDITPATANYETTPDGGFSHTVFFTNDNTYDCAAHTSKTLSGTFAEFVWVAEIDTSIEFPLISNADVVAGRGPGAPFAWFYSDRLSGHHLDEASGKVQIIHLPEDIDPVLRIKIQTTDNSVNGIFPTTSFCP